MNMSVKQLMTFAVGLAALALTAAPPASRAAANRRAAAGGAAEPAAQAAPSTFNWVDANDETVLAMYADLVKKTIVRHPDCPKVSITTKSYPGVKLNEEEQVDFIEAVLEMHGIHLEPYGEKFVRALPSDKARKEGIPIIMDMNARLGETTKLVSMMIPFKNISAKDEAQEALKGLLSEKKGVMLVFERTNSILVTDTEQNINRMLEIARAIDKATPVLEDVFVRQIKYASSDEVMAALQKIVEDSQKELEKNGKQVNQNQAQQQNTRPWMRQFPGRNNQPKAPETPAAAEALVTSVSDADRGLIRGRVLILSDARSNKLIIVTMKSNMDFFDRVIEQLDMETTPDTVVKVYRLDYADAEDVSDMINDLIGNASSSKTTGKANQNQSASKTASGGANLTRQSSTANKSANQRTGEAKAGELSKENTTVLADKRINGLVVMTHKDLVPVVEKIIRSMDIKLSQVLIETCIIEVQLTEEFNSGIDWVHKLKSRQSSVDGHIIQDQALTGGGGGLSADKLADIAANGATAAAFPVGSGLNYYFLDHGLNIGAVISASKSDGNTKYIASPVIMTVDNKEAIINATGMQYLLKGFTSSGNSWSTIAVPDYEQKELGIEIKVTPKINPNGTVMMKIEEKYSQQSGTQTIKYATGNSGSSSSDDESGGGSSALQDVSVPLTVTREMSADVLLENRQTVILGGLTDTFVSKNETGIPILKDIPWIGRYLFGKVEDKETRSELLVFLTPYVMDDSGSAQREARRRKNALSVERPWDDHGWSSSPLADPVGIREQLKRKQREWGAIDEEYESERELQKKIRERAEKLKERAEQEAAEAAEDAAAGENPHET